MRHAGLRQHVAIESAQAAFADQVVQEPSAARAVIHDAHPDSSRVELGGEGVGPPAVGIGGGEVAIVSESPSATTLPTSRGAVTSMPVRKYHDCFVVRPACRRPPCDRPFGEM